MINKGNKFVVRSIASGIYNGDFTAKQLSDIGYKVIISVEELDNLKQLAEQWN